MASHSTASAQGPSLGLPIEPARMVNCLHSCTVVFANLQSIKAIARLIRTHFVSKMRVRVVHLIFVGLVLLVLLVQLGASQRRNRNLAVRAAAARRRQIQARIRVNAQLNGITLNAARRSNRPQSRIANNNTNRGNNRRRRRRLNRLRRRNRRNRRNLNRTSARIVGGVKPRIVGGPVTSISTMPYLVQVHRGGSLCGGSLIRPEWVLTAGHCVSGYSASDFYVVGGTSTQNGTDGVSRRVTFVMVAPRFTKRTMNMDAALMKLNSPMTGTNIRTIALGQRMPRPGSRIRIGGWGATKEGGQSVTNLRVVQLRVVRQRYCRRAYRGSATITRYMFCAQARNKDSCSGDSGGGAVQNNRLLGIVSFGTGCARPGYPGVYTRVSAIRGWVRNVIAAN